VIDALSKGNGDIADIRVIAKHGEVDLAGVIFAVVLAFPMPRRSARTLWERQRDMPHTLSAIRPRVSGIRR